MGPRLRPLICQCKTACLEPEWRISIGPSLHLFSLCNQNCDSSSRITSLYRSQSSFVAFPCKRATLGPELQVSIGPRPHVCFFSPFKTANLAPELHIFMGSSPHLWFCASTSASLWPEIIVSMCPRSNLSFCAWKTAWLASELLVSMGPSPHLWFLHAKQRL